MASSIEFAEILAKTQYCFLEGASSPEELVSTAKTLGYAALGIVDNLGVYGCPRAHVAAKTHGLPLLVGAEILWKDSPLYLLATNLNGYGGLCELLTHSHCEAPWELEAYAQDLIAVIPARPHGCLSELASYFPKRLYLAASQWVNGRDRQDLKIAKDYAEETKLPVIATNQPLMHVPQRKVLHDVLRSIQHLTPVSKAGLKLLPNAERYLKSKAQMQALFAQHPQWLRRTLDIAEQCRFSLDELEYHYPTEWIPEGLTSQQYLTTLTWEGAKKRYPEGIPDKVRLQVQHELKLIHELNYEDYFLTIWDIVQFAQKQKILYQGRGSAANSVVCYVLEITAIDPIRLDLLFERFLSKERHEPPDIDIDFEHERREEVIQYIYQRYGRDRAAISAEVICFRSRSAFREVGKALEVDTTTIESFLTLAHRRSLSRIELTEFQEKAKGLSPEKLARLMTVIQEIQGFPRHIGTHVGGFVLSHQKLSRQIPIEKAAMKDRTIVQWDKTDLDALGFTRVDILGLGILTAIRKCFEIIKTVYGKELTLATIPPEDPKVYDAIAKGDTMGVFQIESRAQMNMLPRLRPRNFFDLVIEISIVRPGPIQGEMVHPYLRRRQGLEKVEYPHPDLEAILKKTYGVPLFQEQIMKMAMVVSDFTGGEADELRRAMGTWRRDGKQRLFHMGDRFKKGLLKKGIAQEYADRIFSQIEGFASYGFPESHAASFALLAYATAFLRVYYVDAYTTALLNSQPMGFYQSHTLLYDATRNGVTVLPIAINQSRWDNLLEKPKTIRLGFREIHGLKEAIGKAIESERAKGPYTSLIDFTQRLQKLTLVTKRDLFGLAAANAFEALGLNRRDAYWEIQAMSLQDSPFIRGQEDPLLLPKENGWESIEQDFQAMGVSLTEHPMRFLRPGLNEKRILTSKEVNATTPNRYIKTAGIVVSRQMPPTANGVCFITLEDEFGFSNLVIWNQVINRLRDPLLTQSFLIISGKVQKADDANVIHLIVDNAWPLLSHTTQIPSNDWG